MKPSTEPCIVVNRRNGPPWVFRWLPFYAGPALDGIKGGWIYQTHQNEYQIFFSDSMYKPIWIGRLFEGVWILGDREVRPISAEIDTGCLHMTLTWRKPDA